MQIEYSKISKMNKLIVTTQIVLFLMNCSLAAECGKTCNDVLVSEMDVMRLNDAWSSRLNWNAFELISSDVQDCQYEGQSGVICSLLIKLVNDNDYRRCSSTHMRILSHLRQAFDSAFGYNWARDPGRRSIRVVRYYLELADRVGLECAEQLNKQMADYAEKPMTILSEIRDKLLPMMEVAIDCKNVPENPSISQANLRSFECLIERLRNKSFDITKLSNLVKLRKFMRKLGLISGLRYKQDAIEDNFRAVISSECSFLLMADEAQASLLMYKSMSPMDDKYFASTTNKSDHFFDSLKALALCDAIVEHRRTLALAVSSDRVGILAKF